MMSHTCSSSPFTVWHFSCLFTKLFRKGFYEEVEGLRIWWFGFFFVFFLFFTNLILETGKKKQTALKCLLSSSLQNKNADKEINSLKVLELLPKK